MSDTRMTVGELKKQLENYTDDCVLVVFYDKQFWPFYKCYLVEEHDRPKIIKDLNNLLGEKLTVNNSFVLLK